jgi:hypothetical protein
MLIEDIAEIFLCEFFFQEIAERIPDTFIFLRVDVIVWKFIASSALILGSSSSWLIPSFRMRFLRLVEFSHSFQVL